MNVFLSWSGTSSKLLAEALRDWLPLVLQSVKPWMSAADIAKGARWSNEIATHLEETRVGILCVTAENLQAPWLLFEAGALSKTLASTFVCPYLLDIEPASLKGPLVQFQSARAEREDTKRLIHTINHALQASTLTEKQVEDTFSVWWPTLEKRLNDIRLRGADRAAVEAFRSDRDLLEELLDLMRDLIRRQATAAETDKLSLSNKAAASVLDKSLAEAVGLLRREPQQDRAVAQNSVECLSERLPAVLQGRRKAKTMRNMRALQRDASRPEA